MELLVNALLCRPDWMAAGAWDDPQRFSEDVATFIEELRRGA